MIERIWARDHHLWSYWPDDIADRLGWLDLPETIRARIPELQEFAAGVREDGIDTVVVCGMGGSSLAPEVYARAAGTRAALRFVLMDTTHPAAVARAAESIDVDRTLFIIASKSGTTVETQSHLAFFSARAAGEAKRFVAITDAGSKLERQARASNFRAVFRNPADVGGRFSALSLFGLVPAALLGIDIAAVLDGAAEMARTCRAASLADNPAATLGLEIAQAAREGRDKLTLLLPDEHAALGSWIEQLVAESTGKQGKGILPVVGEPFGAPDAYGKDRFFVSYYGHGIEALQARGHPMVVLQAGGDAALGAEFFRWEFATAIAGHVLNVNPFDQPDVEAAKKATRALLELPPGPAQAFSDAATVLGSIQPGDYVAIQAYLDPTPQIEAALNSVRASIRDHYGVATTLGFGPRFLHSTGQFHKGGPESGVFIQVADDVRPVDHPIPGTSYSFGTLIDAQALGDMQTLRARGRRVVHTSMAMLARAAARA